MIPYIESSLRSILATVSDPEIPVLTVLDLGVVREARLEDNKAMIKLTPTYTGCPAMDTMATDIKLAMDKEGIEAQVELILSPAWTTDWISEEGRTQLEEYGVDQPVRLYCL